MIRAAAGYIVRNGPTTQQDRWEEDGGYSAFTIAVEISALLAAADAMEAAGQDSIARYLTETADGWNEQIEDWAYAKDTETFAQAGDRWILHAHRLFGRRCQCAVARADSDSKTDRMEMPRSKPGF